MVKNEMEEFLTEEFFTEKSISKTFCGKWDVKNCEK